MYEPIAIIGYGVLYPPNSDNVQNFWKNIKNGVQGIREVTNEVWNVNDYYNEDENVPDKTYCKNSAYLDNTGSLMDYISKFNLDVGLSGNPKKIEILFKNLNELEVVIHSNKLGACVYREPLSLNVDFLDGYCICSAKIRGGIDNDINYISKKFKEDLSTKDSC